MTNTKFYPDEAATEAPNQTTFILSRDGVEKFRGTENDCYMKLQRLQSQSAEWAIKYEGWRVRPETKNQ